MRALQPNRPGPMDEDLADRLRAMGRGLALVASGRDCDVRDLDLEDLQNAASLLAAVAEEDRQRRSNCPLRK